MSKICMKIKKFSQHETMNDQNWQNGKNSTFYDARVKIGKTTEKR